jgi:Recombinase
MKRIAHTLNAEGILSPQPQKGRFNRSWCVSSVRHILLNARYTGKTTWNTRRKVRVPGTGKRVFRPRPQSEWVTSDAPQLRIVSDELATAVRHRLESVKSSFGRQGSGLTIGPKRYLFSGLLKCSVCGGSIRWFLGGGDMARIAMIVQYVISVATLYARTPRWYVETSWSKDYSKGLLIQSFASK